MSTFNWPPNRDPVKKVTPRLLQAQFGDGYSQRIPDGINSMIRTWSLSFNNRDSTEIDSIESFLRATKGSLSFDWTDPDGYTAKWTCKQEMTRTDKAGGNSDFSCVFTEEPGA